MRQDINYDGGMEVAILAQRIPDGTVTHYKHISTGIDLQSTIVATKKTHWKHLSAGIDLQSAIGRKVSRALSGGITIAGTITKFASSQRRALSAGIALVSTLGRVWSIDIGEEAINRDGAIYANNTVIELGTPATNAGIIITVDVYVNTCLTGTNWKVGTFYGSGTEYTCRDYEVLGALSAGYNHKTGLSIDVEKGDFIGLFIPDGSGDKVESGSSGGGGVAYKAGD